jgi:LDH2 family malate/lactate/ureidoglycolate dehydrogenase
MERAISLAKTNGVGVCVAKRLAHWGRGHAYARLAAKRGMIGICTTNAILTMVAWGSSNKLLGNNPLAIGVPRGSGKEPIVLDMAMSTASVGTIRTFLRDNRPIPPDWAVNADGQSSTDPAEVLNGGSVTPFGGHKGAALSVMLELLTGALSGGRLSFELANGDGNAVENQGSKLYFALDVAAFAGRRKFADRVNDFVAWLNRANRGGSIVLPGERSWKARAEHLRNGIPIHAETVAALAASGIRVE